MLFLDDLGVDSCQWQGAPVFSTTSGPAPGPMQPAVQWVGHFFGEQSGRNVTLICHLQLGMNGAILLCGCVQYLHVCRRLGNVAGCHVTACCQTASSRKTEFVHLKCFVLLLVSLRCSECRYAVLYICVQEGATLDSRASCPFERVQ